jgi:hypothetical protein
MNQNTGHYRCFLLLQLLQRFFLFFIQFFDDGVPIVVDGSIHKFGNIAFERPIFFFQRFQFVLQRLDFFFDIRKPVGIVFDAGIVFDIMSRVHTQSGEFAG